MMGRQPIRQVDESWVYPPLVTAAVMAGMKEAETYFYLCQNKVSQFIMIIPIMNLFLIAMHCPGVRVSQRRWVQGGMYLEGKQAESRVEEMEEEYDGDKQDD